MQRLHHIIESVTPVRIAQTLGRLYDPQDSESLEMAVATICHELKGISPRDLGYILEIREGSFPEEPGNFDVLFRRANDPQRYSGVLADWEDWMGVEVPIALTDVMASEEIVAHAIWEMTFHGWSRKYSEAE